MERYSESWLDKFDMEKLENWYNFYEKNFLTSIHHTYVLEPCEYCFEMGLDNFLFFVRKTCEDKYSDCKNCLYRYKTILFFLKHIPKLNLSRDNIEGYMAFQNVFWFIEFIYDVVFSPLKKYYLSKIQREDISYAVIRELPDYGLFRYCERITKNIPSVEDLYDRYVSKRDIEKYVRNRMHFESRFCCLGKKDLWKHVDKKNLPSDPLLILHINNEFGADTKVMAGLDNYLADGGGNYER